MSPESANAGGGLAAGPLFVISMWRSGSSLLYALLNKHPQVGLMYEADLMLLRPVFAKPKALVDWAARWEFWNQAFSRHGLDARDFAGVSGGFRGAFESAHREFARRKGATIWGDKSPNYYDRLREMAETFPAAKFIIVWRNPNATANSILRAAGMGNSYFARPGAALRGLLGYEVFKREYDWLVANDKPVLGLSFEDLVGDTIGVMQQVCRFLDIPYSDGLPDLSGSDRSAIYGGDHHSLVKGDQIVRGPRPNVVSDVMLAKIARYVEWWRTRYGAAWPPFPLPQPEPSSSTPAPVEWREQWRDRVAYLALRSFDSFTTFAFSTAPLSWLQGYRNRKYRGKTSPPAEGKSPGRVPAATPRVARGA